MNILIKTALSLCLLASTNLLAAWQVDNSQSNVSFVSIKKGSIAETHHFTQVDGKISEQGVAKIILDLASIESNIAIRNERMKQHLFEVEKFSSATIESKFEPAILKTLATNQSTTAAVSFTLNLHGEKKEFDTKVRITKLKDSIIVSSMAPTLVNASDFGLVKGINTLRDIAGLPNIATSVPVTFNLAFNKK